MKKLSVILLICLCLSGCGSTSGGLGTSPTISSLRFSPTSTTVNAGGGAVTVNGIFDFQDVDGDIRTYTLTMDGVSATKAIENLDGIISGTLTGPVSVSTTSVIDINFSVFITDSKGNNSNALIGVFSVQ